MSLFDKLMAVDDNVIKEEKTKKVHSDRLSALLGVDTDVTIKKLPFRQVKKIVSSSIKDNGRVDPDKDVDAQCHLIRLAVKDIPWGDEQLQRKFGASDPKDLAEKLFDSDIGMISDAILELSGFLDAEDEEAAIEETVKN